MSSLTVENYVKSIYQICAQADNAPAATGALAAALGVSPGTVTSMLKTLAESGLASYTPYEGVRLTDAGSGWRVRVLRRHRLIEQFLANTLNLSWDEVHEEAENMEHAVSDMLVDRIDEFLGFPEFDPHGDPIPKADGTMSRSDSKRLSKCRVGGVFRLVRVMDQSPEFLRFLADAGLPLGAEGTLTSLEPQAGTLTVRINEQETTIGLEAAEKLLVAGT